MVVENINEIIKKRDQVIENQKHLAEKHLIRMIHIMILYQKRL